MILGERYKEVTDQVIQYALGFWGREGAEYIDPEVKAKVLNRPRARELKKFEMPDPSLEEVRKQYGGMALSDEELLLRYYAGPEFVDALKSAPRRKEYLDARKPLVKLVEDLVNKRGAAHVYIRRNNFTLAAGRRS